MSNRQEIERFMQDLYWAKLRGDLPAVCASFSENAEFRILSTRCATPVMIATKGLTELRPLLALLIKTFNLSDLKIISMIIDESQVAVNWRANVRSKITGATIETEFVDFVNVHRGRILRFSEFSLPC